MNDNTNTKEKAIKELVKNAIWLYRLKTSLNEAKAISFVSSLDEQIRLSGMSSLRDMLREHIKYYEESRTKAGGGPTANDIYGDAHLGASRWHCSECMNGQKCIRASSWVWRLIEGRA